MPLRDAFIYTAIVALLLAGMKIGGILASLIVFLVLIIYSLRVIVAFVGKSGERNAAIGFAIPTTVYLLALAFVGRDEFSIASPHLLTSQLAAMAVKSLGNELAATWEMMSLFHAIAIIVLGAIGSFFAQETARVRDRDMANGPRQQPESHSGNQPGEPSDPHRVAEPILLSKTSNSVTG